MKYKLYINKNNQANNMEFELQFQKEIIIDNFSDGENTKNLFDNIICDFSFSDKDNKKDNDNEKEKQLVNQIQEILSSEYNKENIQEKNVILDPMDDFFFTNEEMVLFSNIIKGFVFT